MREARWARRVLREPSGLEVERCVNGSQRSWDLMGARGPTRDVRRPKGSLSRALGRTQSRAHDRRMRLPWDRSKPPQLDLLGPEEPAPIAEPPAKALTATPDAPPQEVPHMPVVEPLPAPTGEPLLIPLSALCEDPDNPRTEFPQAELQSWPRTFASTASCSRSSCSRQMPTGATSFTSAPSASALQVLRGWQVPVTVRPTAGRSLRPGCENQKAIVVAAGPGALHPLAHGTW